MYEYLTAAMYLAPFIVALVALVFFKSDDGSDERAEGYFFNADKPFSDPRTPPARSVSSYSF